MKGLVCSLPKKDRELAADLIGKRKFEDLWSLVISDIYKVKRNEEDYPEADLMDMKVFKSELSSYLDQLGIDEDELEEDEIIIDDYEEY